jgi:hypothetical protein
MMVLLLDGYSLGNSVQKTPRVFFLRGKTSSMMQKYRGKVMEKAMMAPVKWGRRP